MTQLIGGQNRLPTLTKMDVQEVKLKQVEHDGQCILIKWMLGILIGSVLSIVINFFEK
ncbi:MAG: hypothetical protein Q7U38_01355 [Methylobacter sp.]|nr:hypothetical protein [Methylobacter sp.]MDP2097940.1 hypothetical protein [Methylobacter sp.]MDP2429190.1 hypothetical protein [Methylobacter sp.]MDP3053419.1 hypothetical protein [Methylobacter sp.]MDP3362324.1 hypothetical protein [Methylobacter sp.]